jgi:hypothetical protein
VSSSEGVLATGDLNGDGYDDLIVGGSSVHSYLGSSAGLSNSSTFIREGRHESDSMGIWLDTGDLNADGYDELIIGARNAPVDNSEEIAVEFNYGSAFVHQSSQFGVENCPSWQHNGTGRFSFIGRSLSAAGDVNGDGFGDFLIGSGHDSNRLTTLYYGPVAGPPEDDVDQDGVNCEVDCNDTNSNCGYVCNDFDLDLYCTDFDCAADNINLWEISGSVQDLRFSSNKTTLLWSPPAVPGGTLVEYDTIRSSEPTTFDSSGLCLGTNEILQSVNDEVIPLPGGLFYYLVRSENACGGSIANDSTGSPRAVMACD